LFLLEPARTAWDVHFRIAGIPVRVHPMFWLVSLFLGAGPKIPPKETFIWVFVAFVSILIHELGHAVLIRRFGWSPRVTLYGLGGLASYETRQGYRGSYSSSYSSYDEPEPSAMRQILISLAGPGAGFLFAALTVGAIYLFGGSVHFFFGGVRGVDWLVTGFSNPMLVTLWYFLIYINLFWGLINLLPIYPLDGGRVSRELFLMQGSPSIQIERSLMLSLIVAAAFALYAAVALGSFLTTLMFGYFAVMNYQAIQALRGRGGWQTGNGGGNYGGDDYGGGYRGNYDDDDDYSGRGGGR